MCGMSVEIITKEDLQVFRLQLISDLKTLLNTEKSQPGKTRSWLRSREVRSMLSISAGTLQNLRVTGVLRSSKVGKMHYYSQEDIEKLLSSNRKF
jgi:hypothetical protein